MLARLESPIAGLLATPPARLPYQDNVLVRSFVLQRPEGNVIVYNSPGVTEAASEIEALGGASTLLINHGHEAMYGAPGIAARVFVHEKDEGEVARALTVGGVFTERGFIGEDLEVIPTPGHTAGTTSYLWDNGEHRFLFTGDFIWIENGEWKAVVLGDREAYLASLELVRGLDFDVLVPWGVTDDGPPLAVASRDEIRDRVSEIIARVKAGSDR